MTDSRARTRKQLMGMFAIALVAMGGAYALFYSARQGGVWGTTNNGTFVNPPIAVSALTVRDENGKPLEEGETWWLWVVAPDACEGECQAAVHQLRQLHVLLNKDADRVRRALVTESAAVPEVVHEYPRLVHLQADTAPLTRGIYIVDPIGNLVLHYPYSDAGAPVLEDLKRLLKLSRIG